MTDSFEQFEVVYDGTNREEWLALRRHGIGGSDAPGVLGVSPWASPVSVFADKVLGDEGKLDTEPMFWGRTLEPIIREHFSHETGRVVLPDGRLLRNKQRPWMQVTLDGVQENVAGKDGTGALEIKNTRFPVEDVPEHYWVQMQHQYAVTGFSWGSFAVLSQGCAFFWCDVPRDDKFIEEALIPAERKLWERVRNSGPTPSPDASDATLDALKRLYPGEHVETTTLGGDFVDADVERQEIQLQLRALEERKQAIDNGVKAALGNAEEGVMPNGRRYTWKKNKKGVRCFRAPALESEQEK